MDSIRLVRIVGLVGLSFLVLFGHFASSEGDDGSWMTRAVDCEKESYSWNFNDCKKKSCERDIRKSDKDPNSMNPVRGECVQFYEKFICVYRYILKGTRGSYQNSVYDYDTSPPNPNPEKCTQLVHGHDPCWNSCVGWAWAEDESTGDQAAYPRAYSCLVDGKKYCTCTAISKLRKNEQRIHHEEEDEN